MADPWLASPTTQSQGSTEWADYPKAFGGAVANILGDQGAGLRSLAESGDQNDKMTQAAGYLGRVVQDTFGGLDQDATNSMSDAAKAKIQSTITDPDFWTLSAMTLKGTQMTPSIAAVAIPSYIMAGTGLGAATVAAVGGEMSAVSVVDEMYKATDSLSDGELRQHVPIYDEMRRNGSSEQEARIEYNKVLRGLRPLYAAGIGAIANSLGPAGQIARGLSGKAASAIAEEGAGLLQRGAIGAAEGAIGAGGQAGGEDYLNQSAKVEGGLQDNIDYGQVANTAISTGAFGGVIGAVAGAGFGGHANTDSPAKTNVAESNSSEAVVPDAQPGSMAAPSQQAQPSRSGATASTDIPAPDPYAGMSRRERRAAAANAAFENPEAVGVQKVAPTGGDAAQTMALNATKPPEGLPPEVTMPQRPTVTPPEQMAAELPNSGATTPAPTSEVAPPAPPPGVEGRVQPDNVANPAARVSPEPVPAPAAEVKAGPRVLDSLTPEAQQNRAAMDDMLSRNLAASKQPAPGDEPVPATNNRSKALLDARQATRDAATKIVNEFAPAKGEELLYSKKPSDVTGAKQVILARARAMVERAQELKAEIPKAFRNSTDQFNPETMTLMDARALVNAADNSKKGAQFKHYDQFVKRELDVRSGAADQAIAERRAEGDASRKVAQINPETNAVPLDTIREDVNAPIDSASPENILLAREEAGVNTQSTKNPAPKGEPGIPTRVQNAVDEALAQASKKPKPFSVEVKKGRKLTPANDRVTAAVRDIQEKVAKANEASAEAGKRVEEARQRNEAKKVEVTDKIKEIQQKLDEAKNKPTITRLIDAREKTNTSPTEAQVKSGNYAKGKVSIQGHEISLETPKGASRTGVDANGKPWSVKMAHDYGYFRGTKGADGEHIDVLVGPNHDAKHYYVVDQVHPETRVFDEHKVMMGFDSEAAATKAYDRMFSDGKGALRAGAVTKMTPEEFRAWKANQQVEPTAFDRADDIAARSALPDVTSRGKAPEGYVTDPMSGQSAKPVLSRKGADVLNELDITHLAGAPRALAGIIRNHLSKLVGDMDVHFVTPEDMHRLGDYADGEPIPQGYHVMKGNKEQIFIRSDIVGDKAKMAHTIMHELVHSATVKAIGLDPVLKGNVRALMDHIEKAMPLLETGDVADMHYGMRNEKEFIAEAMSNPAFQNILSKIPASDAVVSGLKLDRGGVRNMWDALVKSIRRALKLPDGAHSMLDAAIRVSERAFRPIEQAHNTREMVVGLINGDRNPLIGAIKDEVRAINERRRYAPEGENPRLLGIHSFDYIARTADRFFGENNPVRRVTNAMESMRTTARRQVDEAAPIVDRLRTLEAKYKGQQWEDFTQLLHEETMNGVFADRPLDQQRHISKEGSRDAWMRAAHADLSKRYDALPDDLKTSRKEALNYFQGKRNEMALKTLENRIVTLFDAPDPEGLAQRIHADTVTDADKKLLGDAYETIKQAGTLSKVDGPYFPLMRRGSYVVKATLDVPKPSGAREISPNEFEFTDKEAAAKWMGQVAKDTGRPTMSTVYVDANGETHGVTPEGNTARYTAEDFGTHPVYRVSVQDRHVEMFDTMSQARDRVAELRKAGVNTDDAVPRQFEGYGVQLDALSTHMRKMISGMEQRAEARGMSAEQIAELRQSLGEASLQMLGSTRISARALPRKYVAGASKDIVRNTLDYAHAAGNQIAKLDHRPEIDKAIADMNQYIKDHPQDGLSSGRQQIANTVMKRVTTPNPIAESKVANAFINRILAFSFMDKLASPSYSVINAAQPMMTTTPYLAGQYGIGRAVSAMTKAYNDVGSLKAIAQGLKDTAAKAKGAMQTTDPATLIMSRIKDVNEKAMLQVLLDRGVIDADSGLEVGHVLKQSNDPILGKVDAGLGYFEGIVRQMPKTVEAINRTVSALAAYRLEMARSGDHARAIQFAHDTVNRTQFNYSMENAAPWMRHPAARLAFQFKKYGLGMYQLLGEQIGIAYRNAEPGDRAKAIKSLSYTLGMHALMAGALGLPTEPIKMAVLAANGLGMTNWTWGDVESAEREMAANAFGKDMGEIISRGVPRAFGIDLSTRMGLDTLMGPFGEPRSNEAAGWKAYMWDNFSGAPVGLLGDWASGVNSIAAGDFGRAAEKLIPLKIAADAIKAYRTHSEGTVSAKTGKQVMSPYSIGEAVSKTLGFAPAREAESYERSGTFYRRGQALEDQRSQLQRDWASATSATKGRVWREVVKWNKSVSPEARLTIKDLRGYQKRAERDMHSTQEGIRAKRREVNILNRANRTYDYTP